MPVLAATLTIVIEKCLEAVVMLACWSCSSTSGGPGCCYPLVVAAVAVFAASLAYCLAVAIVHFRDTGQIVAIVMQLWFFLTPVMYPVDMIPEEWNGIPLRSLLALNPMADFVEISRDLLYDAHGSAAVLRRSTASCGRLAMVGLARVFTAGGVVT